MKEEKIRIVHQRIINTKQGIAFHTNNIKWFTSMLKYEQSTVDNLNAGLQEAQTELINLLSQHE